MSKLTKNMIFKLLFLLFFVMIIGFFSWSGFFIISILLLFFADCITTQFAYHFLKKKLSKRSYSFFKYLTYFLLIIGLAIFCRVFFFEIYSIPSSSMESTLSQGDMIVINKLAYGPRMPSSVAEVPFGKLISSANPKKNNNFKDYDRLAGFGEIKRHDIIVFKGFANGSTKKFVKRIIGMPGETIHIDNSKVYVNGSLLNELPKYVFDYKDTTANKLTRTKVYSNEMYKKLAQANNVNIARDIHLPKTEVDEVFPKEKIFEWNRDYYGPVTIPKKGTEIILIPENIIFYKDVIVSETQQKVTITQEAIFVNGQKITRYVFLHDYFFVMGDNRHFSRDSRAAGFVPVYAIEGKLWFSF